MGDDFGYSVAEVGFRRFSIYLQFGVSLGITSPFTDAGLGVSGYIGFVGGCCVLFGEGGLGCVRFSYYVRGCLAWLNVGLWLRVVWVRSL